MKEVIRDLNKEDSDSIYFFTPPYYVLDNFSAFQVEIWGKVFMTPEHAYQWKKYSEDYPDIAESIFNAKSPHDTKKIADANKDKVSEEFHANKPEIMKEILRAKLGQHEKVKKTLVQTGNKKIIENNQKDEFWGIGTGNGKNMLGKLWMELRDNI